MWNKVFKVLTYVLWVVAVLTYAYVYFVITAYAFTLAGEHAGAAFFAWIVTVLLVTVLGPGLQYLIEHMLSTRTNGNLYKLLLYLNLQTQALSIIGTGRTFLFRKVPTENLKQYIATRFKHPAQLLAELAVFLILYSFVPLVGLTAMVLYNWLYERYMMKPQVVSA